MKIKIPYEKIEERGHIQDASQFDYIKDEIFNSLTLLFEEYMDEISEPENSSKFNYIIESAQKRGYFEIEATLDGYPIKLELLDKLFNKTLNIIDTTTKTHTEQLYEKKFEELGRIIKDFKETLNDTK